MKALWQLASHDPELATALREVHSGLLEEQSGDLAVTTAAALTAAVEAHLLSAELAPSTSGPVTVGAVAEELFRHTPDRLSAEAHVHNEKLRASREPLPDDLGLSKLIAWAEGIFGSGPSAYWKAFRQVALKLELRRSAEVEYQLAARRAPNPEDKR
jgi:hypothetical protein